MSVYNNQNWRTPKFYRDNTQESQGSDDVMKLVNLLDQLSDLRTKMIREGTWIFTSFRNKHLTNSFF